VEAEGFVGLEFFLHRVGGLKSCTSALFTPTSLHYQKGNANSNVEYIECKLSFRGNTWNNWNSVRGRRLSYLTGLALFLSIFFCQGGGICLHLVSASSQ